MKMCKVTNVPEEIIAMKLVVCFETVFLMSQFGSRKSKSTNNAIASIIHNMVGYLNYDVTSNCYFASARSI
jgi:hypothetical protein